MASVAAFGVAHAEATVYGLIDMSIGQNQLIGDPQTNIHSGGDAGSSEGNSTTKIGFKGNADLGSGVKGNFQLESGGIASNGSVNNNGNFFNRQAWVGLSGGFGEVRVGRQDNVPFQVMGEYDFNGASNAASAQQNAQVAEWSFFGRQSRSLQYISPDLKGFTAQVGYQPQGDGYNNATAAAAGADANKANYSIGLKYKIDKLSVAVAGQTATADNPGNGSTSYKYQSFSTAAASYDFTVVKAMVGYANGGTGFSGTTVGVIAPVAGFNVGLTYAKNNDTYGNSATEFYVNREVLKSTYAYFDYGQLKQDVTNPNGFFATGNTGNNTIALGVIYVF